MTKEPGAVRSVSTYAGLLQAIADLRDYGHPLSQATDTAGSYDVKAGRKIYVTAPIVQSGRLSLGARDTGLEIEFLPFCSWRHLDLVVEGGTIVLRGLTSFGFVPTPDAAGSISVENSGFLLLDSPTVLGVDVSVDGTSTLSVRGAVSLGGSITTGGSLLIYGSHAAECDLVISGGNSNLVGSTLGDVDISGGNVDGHGRFGDVETTGGAGSFKYADCDSFTDGGGTWISPVV